MDSEANLHTSRAITASIDIPLSADADTSSANAIYVYFAMHGFEAACVDGVMLEDQIWPTRCGHMAGKEVVATEEKVHAALEARQNPDFAIKARTDAVATPGVKNVPAVLRQSVTEGRVIERPELAVSFQESNDLMGSTTICDIELRFLPPAQCEAKYGAAR